MERKVVSFGAAGVVALALARPAFAQTAVERNLPPAPVATPAPVETRSTVAQSDDATPLGANLKAIILLDGKETVRDAGQVHAGVDMTQVPMLNRRHLIHRLVDYLGQPLSRKLIGEIEADIARAARTTGRPFVSLATPEQEITSGVLQIRVTEFQVGDVTVRGIKGRDARAMRRDVRVQNGAPVNSRSLAEDLDWLNRNSFVQVGAQFAPATQAGRTDLTLAATATAPVRVYAGWSNTGSQSTGFQRYFVGTLFKLPLLPGAYASYQLTGSGDAWLHGGKVLPSDPSYRAQGGRIYVPTAARQDIEITVSDALTNQVVNSDFIVRQRTTEATIGYRSALSNLGAPAGWGDLLVGIEGKRTLAVTGYTVSDGNDGANYRVALVTATGDIAQRALAVTLNDASKTVGQADPAMTFTVGGDGMVAGDAMSGTAARDAGDTAGTYAINQGSLSAGANYAVTFTPGTFTVRAGTTTGGGTATGGGTTTGGVTPAIVKQAAATAAQALRTTPSRTPLLSTLPAGSVTGFDAYAPYMAQGATLLPGTPATSVQVTFETKEAAGADAGSDRLCQGSASKSCASVGGSGLPYSANRVIAPNVRFTSK